jgi:hypothetical protein
VKIATVDLETFWDTTHSLTKMSPIEYCMHPETDIISCAFKFDNATTEVVFGERAVIEYANKIDWSQYWVVGHNLSGFEAMSRPIHAKDAGGSLAALVEHYGLGKKDQSALIATKGKRLRDFSNQEIEDMRRYNAADVDQCYQLLRRLIPQTRRDEVKLIDMTVRMLVEPQFEADMELLANTFAQETERKKAMLQELGRILTGNVPLHLASRIHGGDDYLNMSEDEVLKLLSSAAKFALFLQTVGVAVPTKVSPTTGKDIPALAKTDEAFLALQEHDNPLVATAAAARLDAKSTLLQTRIQAFMDAANANPQKRVPIPLKYYGADTTGRWSGWAYNPQNLPRINPADPKPSDALRMSLRAPKGHKVVVADLSGIELRVNHFLWKVPSSMALYQADPEKADLYKDFASRLYDIPVEEVTKQQRQVGKVAHLGLGFGAGPATFQKVAKLMGGVDIDLDEARDVVEKWRTAYSEIVQGWRTCHNALPAIMRGAKGAAIDPWGMVTPCPEGLKTPKGMIRYPDLRTERNDDGKQEFVYGHGRHKARIYAGKIDENIVQHLARCVIADNALEVQKLTGYTPALMVHDELVYVADDAEAVELLDTVQQVMRTPPEWWPELVTWSEGDIAETYGGAK